MSSDHAVVSYRGINADAKYVVPIIRETKVRGEIHARDSEDTLARSRVFYPLLYPLPQDYVC